jgi:hypothetical protein
MNRIAFTACGRCVIRLTTNAAIFASTGTSANKLSIIIALSGIALLSQSLAKTTLDEYNLSPWLDPHQCEI